jgi:hypothetical protein
LPRDNEDVDEPSSDELPPCVRFCGDGVDTSGSGLFKKSIISEVSEARVLEKRVDSLQGLQGQSRSVLSDWISTRVVEGNNIELIFSRERDGAIRLKDDQGYTRNFGIPTAFFTDDFGDSPIAWGNIGLVGCTLLFLIKEPTPRDPTTAMYMAHIWE